MKHRSWEKIARRFIALLLGLVMLISQTPATALAKETARPDYLLKLPDGTTLEVADGYTTLTADQAESLADTSGETRTFSRKARSNAVSVPVNVNQENAKAGAAVPAKYLNFQCQTAWETAGEGQSPSNNNLNDEGKTALIEKHGTASLPAGHIKTYAPVNFINPETGASHNYARATVKGVPVYQIGTLTIDGQEYAYYITSEETDSSGLTVYSVLRAEDDSFNPETTDPKRDDAHITLWYTHTTGGNVNYEVTDDKKNPSGETVDSIFGDHRTLMTADDGSLDFTVTIPRGYQATVEVQNEDSGYTAREISFKGENRAFTSLKMGVMRRYEDGKQTQPDAAKGGSDARTAVISVLKDGDTAMPLNVKVTLTKQGQPTFSPTWWLNKTDKNVFNFGGYDAATKEQIEKNGQTIKMSDAGNGTYKLPGNNDSDTWTIRSRSWYDNNNITTVVTYALSTLEINGERINVPRIEDPPAPYKDPSTEAYEQKETADTTLSTGTHIGLTVQAKLTLNGKNQAVYVRTYTLEADNCMEDLTITDGTFIKNTQKKLNVTLKNVSGEAWVHTDVTGHLTDYEAEIYSNASWVSMDSSVGTMLDRTNSDTTFNWYSDPIRFKRETGYAAPTVKVYAPNGELLQENAALTDEGKVALGPNNLAVELVRLEDTADENNLSVERIKRDDVKKRYPQYASYMDNKYVHHGFSDVMKEDNFDKGNASSTYYKHWLYNDWSQNPSKGGYYYIRGTQALDQYLLAKNQNQIYSRVATIEISAEPLKANINYLNGAKEMGGTGPSADTIRGMGFVNGEWTDTNGYNLEDKETLQIFPTALTTTDPNYYFSHWELVSVEDRSEKPAANADAVGNYKFTTGQYIHLSEMLGDDILVENSYFSGPNEATYTLRAVWSKTPTTQATAYTANYYYVNDKEEPTKIAAQTYEIPLGGKVQANLYNSDGSLTDNVYKILNGTAEGCLDPTKDYTESGKTRFSVHTCTNEGDEKHKTETSIEAVRNTTDNTINVYLSEVKPVARFTVTKKWEDLPEGVSSQAVSVQLKQKALSENDWKDYGNSVKLEQKDGAWSFTWNDLPAYKDNDKDSGMYEYKAVELDGDGNEVAESNGKTTIGGLTYDVSYDAATHNVLEGDETEEQADGRTPLHEGDVDWSGTITNTYYNEAAHADLTIEKSLRFANSGAPESDEFKVFIHLADKDGNALTDPVKYAVYQTGETKPTEGETSKTMSLTDGTGTVELEAGQSVVLYDLAQGTKYTITDGEKDSYAAAYKDREGNDTEAVLWDESNKQAGTMPYTSKPLTGTIIGGKDDTVKIINTYLGDVTVEKKVESSNNADKTKIFDIHVALSPINGEHITGTFKINSGGADGYVKFAQGSTGSTDRNTSIATVSLKDTETVTICGLPAGVSYQVHEHLENTGFTAEVKYNDVAAASSTATETINGGSAENKAEITNTRQTASLNVVLNVSSEVKSDQTKEFKFKLTLKDEKGMQSGGPEAFSLSDTKSEGFEDLPAGYQYEITADGVDADIYRISYNPGASGTLRSGENTVNVSIERRTGELSVAMTVTGDGADQTKAFTYTVKLKDGQTDLSGAFGGLEFKEEEGYTFQLKHGDSMRLTGLPAGVTYTVTQQEEADYTTTPADLTAEGTIRAGQLIQESFENARGAGQLTISKEVTNTGGVGGVDAGDIDKEFQFTVSVKGTNLKDTYDYEGAGGKADGNLTLKEDGGGSKSGTITLKGGQSVTIQGLPQGTAYTIAETEVKGYSTKYQVDGGTEITGHTATGAVDADGASVAFTNDYTGGNPQTLTVTKKWEDGNNQDGSRPEKITVNVMRSAQGESGKTKAASIELGKENEIEGGDWSGTVTNLPTYDTEGRELAYSVKEEGENSGSVTFKNDYTYTVTYDEDDRTITNRYDPKKVNVTVKKEWANTDGKGGTEAPKGAEVSVQLYKNGEPDGDPVSLNQATGWTHTWEGLTQYEGGDAIAYSVKELKGAAGVDEGGSVIVSGNDYSVSYQTDGNATTITNTMLTKKACTVNYYQDTMDGEPIGTDTIANAWAGQQITLQPGTGNGQLDHYRPKGYVSGVQQGVVPYTVKGSGDVINVVYEPFGNPYKQVKVGTDGTPATATIAYAGDRLTYSITWKNETQEEQTITITDQIPKHTVLVPGTIAPSGTEKDGLITWEDIKVAAGSSVTVEFAVTIEEDVTPDTRIENTAQVTYQTGDGGSETKPSDPVVTTVTEDYSVTFNEGGHGTIDGADADGNIVAGPIQHGQYVTEVPKPAPEDENWEFIGWYLDGDDSGTLYTDGDIYTMPVKKDLTFTAQYRETSKYTLHYESNGGTKYDDEVYKGGDKVELGKVPVRDGYTFTGWYADKELTKPVTSVEMRADTTVYAGWKAAEKKAVEPSGSDTSKPGNSGTQNAADSTRMKSQTDADKAVQTGDPSPVGLWIALMLASGAAAVGATAYRRKKR